MATSTAVPAIATSLGSQRAKFDMPGSIAYFNTANLAPRLAAVTTAGKAAVEATGRPWMVTADRWFADSEALRADAAGLMGVTADAVAFVPSSSYGLAVAARNVIAELGDRVIVLEAEFPSNYYTWHRFCRRTGAELVVVRRAGGETWTQAVTAAMALGARVVAVPNLHWTNGAPLDLVSIAESAKAMGAALVIDASQSLGAMPLDIGSLQPDFVVAVGYKWLLGPYATAYLYAAEKHWDGEPIEENWINRAESEDFAALVEYRNEYRAGARRFDVGERSNFVLVPMAHAAIKQILEWGVGRIASELERVTSEIRRRVTALGLEVSSAREQASHLLGIDLPPGTASGLAETLRERGVVAAVRGGSIRISPHLHVTAEDVDRLIEGIESAL